MANIEQIRMLCQGVNAWNEARSHDPFIPRLTHVEVRGAALPTIDLRDADLDGSTLSDVDLRNASLDGAHLNGLSVRRVQLADTQMKHIELKGSDFVRICLQNSKIEVEKSLDLKIRHSDLRGMHLEGELPSLHFYNCDLRGANLANIRTNFAVLKRCLLDPENMDRLRERGLEIELPNQPHTNEWIDWSRFAVRTDNEEFGFVVHDGKRHWIRENRWDAFVSYAHSDKEVVGDPLVRELQKAQLSVWYDEFEMKPGDRISTTIDFGTSASVFGVVIISPAFFGRKWTEAELAALSHKRVFIVLHEMSSEELAARRPELGDLYCVSTASGIDRVAEQLVEAIEHPRRLD